MAIRSAMAVVLLSPGRPRRELRAAEQEASTPGPSLASPGWDEASPRRACKRAAMRRAAAGLAVLAVLATAGCGGDSSPSAAEVWAGSVCTSLDTYITSLKGIGQDVTKAGLSESTLKDASGQAQSATQTFLDDLKELGAPE